MASVFTQSVSVHKTGFGNSVKVSVGNPVVDGVELEHPYIPAGSVAKLVKSDGEGETTLYENQHEKLSMWGIPGEDREFECEVGYDSSAQFTWTLDSIEVDGETIEQDEPSVVTFRMWGETESWGSEGEKVLFWPYSYKRDVDNH